MSKSKPTTEFIVELTEARDPAPVRTSLKAFLRFSAEISYKIEELEDRFSHLSAPQAGRSKRHLR